MLAELTIKNIALIESLRIEFSQGFNVLTGETGAGKSIVVDCVNLALGSRADRDIIRTGAEKGMVQALFDVSSNSKAMAYAEELGLDTEDGMIAVSRELSRSGRNICRMAGVIMPLNNLRQLTSYLVDVHGQHEHQALMNPAKHMDFLDNFGGETHAELRKHIALLHSERNAIGTQLKKLMNDASEKERLSDILSFQVQEITAAHLKPGEEEKLAQKLSMLENSEKIRTGIEEAYSMVYEGDGRSLSAQESLLRAAEAMQRISGIDERFASIANSLREVYYSAQDVGYELQSLMDGLNSDPELLDKISARLDLIKRLERKYGNTVEEVIKFGSEAASRLDELKSSENSIDGLKKKYKAADAKLREACEKLTAVRKTSSAKLAGQICEQLADLGMSRTRFEVRVEPETKPTSCGMDKIEFMISPNPGEPLRPLVSIASGGEISRIMLALKVIAMNCDGVDTMIFDEIDTGVSGRMAQTVGEKMCLISQNRQVLCVTHLPQIAALGDTHFRVEKIAGENRTDSNVRRLDRDGRVCELSRLVGGAEDSESSLSHAASMLVDADKTKENLKTR